MSGPTHWKKTMATVILLVLVHPTSVIAELGGDVPSVLADRVRLGGALRVRGSDGYTIYEIVDQNETMVREFVSPSGVVFAISWEGRFVPQLQDLLGTSFARYAVMLQQEKTMHPERAPLNIHEPQLAFENGGHMGWYYGRAYLPQGIPRGIDARVIH